MRKRLITAIIALSLALCCLVGVTVAWLTDSTEEVKNVFTVGDIEITLTETPNNGNTWTAQMIPGKEYTKDPVVSVVRPDTNVDIYLFVKFEQNNNAATYLVYESLLNADNGWTELTAGSGVWYRTVKASDTDISWNLLKDNKVTIHETNVKKDTFDNVTTLPELVYTAYAIQTEGFTPQTAWAELNPTT